MPVRNTSKAAFLEIQEDNIAAAQRIRILNYVRKHPGVSRREIRTGLNLSIEMGSVCGRANELLNSGALVEGGCKHCQQTGRSVNLLFVAGDEA